MISAPCLFIVFGATGDLTGRKLLPALYRLARRGDLAGSHILGVARSTNIDDQAFRQLARNVISTIHEQTDPVGQWCDYCVHYRSLSGDAESFRGLASEI